MTPSKWKGARVEAPDEPTEQHASGPWDPSSISEEVSAEDGPVIDDAPSINPTTEHPVPKRRAPDEDDAVLPPGVVLGEYQIEKPIGEGGMGVVYSARHPKIGKRAAVKVLRSELCRQHFNVERFVDEARVVNQIGHPNIVDIFAFGETADGRSYFVMEWLRGESLRARVARSRMDLDEICDVIRPLARALEAAHEAGVIHRDLKPDNIFLVEMRGEAPLVKLLDFGIAKLAREEHRMERTATGAMVGTPQYIAPEQAKGYTIDHTVDIYSLGGILFELITGRPPFVADNAMEMVAKHLMEPPPRPSAFVAVPPELDDLVVRMLAKQPSNRPSLAEVATVIERTSALDRTNVKTPIVPPAEGSYSSDQISVQIPTPTPYASSTPLRQSGPAIGAAHTPAPPRHQSPALGNPLHTPVPQRHQSPAFGNPVLDNAMAKAMAAPIGDSKLDPSEMTETIRAERKPGGKKAPLLLLGATLVIAFSATFLIVRQIGKKPASPEPSASAQVVEPSPTASAKPIVEPIEQANVVDQAKEPLTTTDDKKPEASPTPSPTPTPSPAATKLDTEPKPKTTPKPIVKKQAPEPAPKLGKLELKVSGGGATPKIMIDGKTGGLLSDLTVGTHTVVVSSQGFKTSTVTITIKEGTTTRKEVSLDPAKATPPIDPDKDGPKEEDLMKPGTAGR